MMRKHRLELMISPDEVARRIGQIAETISKDYKDKEVVLVGVLKGAFVFLADLIRSLTVPVEVDFVRAASYGKDTTSSGRISLSKDVEVNLVGRDVILVEDIVDTGITLLQITEHLQSKSPRSLRVCVLIDKHERREVEIPIDYCGFRIPSGFVVGCGLDWAERYRELSGIFQVKFDDGETTT